MCPTWDDWGAEGPRPLQSSPTHHIASRKYLVAPPAAADATATVTAPPVSLPGGPKSVGPPRRCRPMDGALLRTAHQGSVLKIRHNIFSMHMKFYTRYVCIGTEQQMLLSVRERVVKDRNLGLFMYNASAGTRKSPRAVGI